MYRNVKYFLLGLLVVASIPTYNYMQTRLERSKLEALQQTSAVQMYAGDPMPAVAQEFNPVMYSCANEKEHMYLVIAPATGEFMLFDRAGAWINRGQFFQAKTDQGVEYYHAEIGNNLLGMFLDDNKRWHLAIAAGDKATDMLCN